MARNDMDRMVRFITSNLVEEFHKVVTVSGECANCDHRGECAMYVKNMQGAFDRWLTERARAN